MNEISAKRFGVQRCGIFSELPATLREVGAEPEPLLSAHGFSLADFEDQDALLPFAPLVRLLDACARATGAAEFGLLLGARAQLSHLGHIGEMVRFAPTLRRAIRCFVEHHHRYVRGGAPYLVEQDPYLVRHRDEMLIGYRCLIEGLPAFQYLLVPLAAGRTVIHQLSGHYPNQVLLESSSSGLPVETFAKLVKPASLRFDSHHFGLTYPVEVLDAPLPGADPKRFRAALARVNGIWNGLEPDFVDRIRRLLLPVVLADRAHMRTLSESTNLTPRTINRRLAEQGTTLRALVNETRYDIARQLLRHTELPVARVAAVMGYSEPGVFVRAFRQWSGSTPDAWRRNLAPRAEEAAGR